MLPIKNQNQIIMNKKDLFYHPVSWVVFVFVAISAAYYTYQNFESANPIVSLDIQMDRESALAKAQSLASEFSIGPKGFKQAAAFDRDGRFQTFVELEGGGLDSFTSCIEKGNYYAYYWEVRHFKEHETNEVKFWFTPEGKPLGFSEKIGEAEKGAALSEDEALKVAEHHAAYNWDVDFSLYQIIEKSSEERISGRIDHTFVYEREDISIGEGKFRVKLTVSGDKLSAVDYFVKVPEEFDRRYSEMRSDNDTIATIASGIIFLFYGILGVILGIFFLMRRRSLIWKKPLFWGLAIAMGSVFLLTINNLPISWFSYDTSTSQSNFLFRQLLNGLLGAFGFGAVIAISTMAAEGLGRLAFPKQIQFWKLWSKDVAASKQVLGQSVAGYLFAIIILGIDVLFYRITTTHLGWWSPAGSLSDPNILANYLPWLDSIAISLQAGFWEEILFRAVPIAGVFLLTKNKKSRALWVVLILIVQTLVFGAGHANYPNQPSYARVIEMVVPFAIMGIIYIYYGLLPAIIAHYAVDVFWISLPLWVSSAPGIWLDRILVLLFLFVPIWIVLFYYIKNKRLKDVPEEARNAAWLVPEKEEELIEEEVVKVESKSYKLEKWLLPAGIIGLVLWFVFTPFKQDAPKLNVSKQEARDIAIETLSNEYGIDVNEWEVLSSVSSNVDIKDIFIWKEFGQETYQDLLGDFLGNPYWKIRLVKTTGAVEERGEEFLANVTINEEVFYTSHTIPESKEGAVLSKDSAQVLVDEALLSKHSVERTSLKEISVTPKKLDKRTDWEFIYADTINYSLELGQGRYLVSIAGDEVTSVSKFIYVPEDWMREYKDKQSKQSIVRMAGQIFSIGIIIFGLVLCIIRWTRKKFRLKTFIIVSLFIVIVYLLDVLNSWDSVKASYTTFLPYSNFITMALIGVVIVGIFWSLFAGIFVGATIKWLPVQAKVKNKSILNSIALGAFLYGILELIESFAPKTKPVWESIGSLNDFVPIFGFASSKLFEGIMLPALMILIFLGIHFISRGFTSRKVITIIMLIVVSLMITTSASEHILFWIPSALLFSAFILAVYLFFIRQNFHWLPLTFGIFLIFEVIEKMVVNAVPEAIPGGILFIVLAGALYYYWYRQLVKPVEGHD